MQRTTSFQSYPTHKPSVLLHHCGPPTGPSQRTKVKVQVTIPLVPNGVRWMLFTIKPVVIATRTTQLGRYACKREVIVDTQVVVNPSLWCPAVGKGEHALTRNVNVFFIGRDLDGDARCIALGQGDLSVSRYVRGDAARTGSIDCSVPYRDGEMIRDDDLLGGEGEGSERHEGRVKVEKAHDGCVVLSKGSCR
ncbi:hypothetical protein P171DRAFT_198392 [Karstenula rhodostoma CBS 690.94]|uniref:Uncharacterized protein n=1 Tax=Karstenula rhodostoma CBS 690.94 TaxID=1392251 RepID=A0A9P4PSZ0_9PLEO|nr:hypothetical protein P171DRAFT_198392 [Karstenula rhodostoma CBS 690.94]